MSIISNNTLLRDAIKIVPKVTGNINPFIAPAIINNLTGLPIVKKIIEEITINNIITKFLWF